MHNQSSHLQLNIGFIAQQTIGFCRIFIFDIPHIHLRPDLALNDLVGKISVSRTSEGLLAQVELNASVEMACVRCLKKFSQVLQVDFTELFYFAPHARSDTEMIIPEDGNIDFGPLIREYTLLEIPTNPVCKGDCKGLCPICGNDLNDNLCNHEPEAVASRFAILKTLLDDE